MCVSSSLISSSSATMHVSSRISTQFKHIPVIHKSAFTSQGQNRRLSSRLNAISRKKQTKQQDNLQIPDTAPLKDSLTQTPDVSETEQTESSTETPETEVSTPSSTTAETTVERLSADEIRQQMSQLRASNAESQAKEGFVEGVLEEVQLIQWPSPGSALLNTLLVIAIVAGTSLVLFGVNTTLAELSREVYKSL